VTANEFYAADPRRECRERRLGGRWRVDGTSRSAEVRWFAETGELVIVDREDYAVWAIARTEAAVEALLRDDVMPAARTLAWLRRALDRPTGARTAAASRFA
jgi:hypothetical protein